ncbi:hybrid sensor histidine kinase/response regulator [Psychrobium sp. 1_MG-2023]|uniref:hybrid sensor histidine kinase/response regulator n=1 Tax=Psychrobium sp. 1_MG-2023 TaxID=3062624 RepID=UPI000C337B67|nr:hybrid sensor histidine kinase/response regulator [Psychrobium sp. 1_MG-2023]MDP2560906.1 hybrid sensor histidine kinase/response regulator [Psychrobium sp. 1_MG-2023]PKF55980.1 hybrid sensor histidine kinase/response regulator [Alteromonadales bacterium alter-6D02]
MNSTKPKLLIVDDEPNNHRVYERTLESLDIEFVKAFSGQQALAVAHREDFFLILMDVQMPGMDGFETASLLLDHPKTSHIPVIFITAFARDEAFEFKGYASGAVDYLVKPINDKIVRSKVEVFLELYKEKIELDEAYKVKKKAEDELRQHKDNLEDLVKERTQELQLSLNNLLETQNQLVESEKMASLGRLVAGVAHELNTPIGVCVTATSYLHEESKEFSSAVMSSTLSRQDFDKYIKSSNQSIDIILTNLERASEMIRNFKLVAVDVSSETIRDFNLLDYIESIVMSLHPETRRSHVDVTVEGDSTIEVNINPGALSQIVTNLVMNSLIHAFDGEKQGQITINLAKEDEVISLIYSDDGAGMSQDTCDMIFEPFFTTRRGCGGSGLGMYIVYNLTTQTFNGEVKCKSELGKGSTFELTFPSGL